MVSYLQNAAHTRIIRWIEEKQKSNVSTWNYSNFCKENTPLLKWIGQLLEIMAMWQVWFRNPRTKQDWSFLDMWNSKMMVYFAKNRLLQKNFHKQRFNFNYAICKTKPLKTWIIQDTIRKDQYCSWLYKKINSII